MNGYIVEDLEFRRFQEKYSFFHVPVLLLSKIYISFHELQTPLSGKYHSVVEL